MLARICHCCGQKLEEASASNPNICVACDLPLAEEASAPVWEDPIAVGTEESVVAELVLVH